MPLPSGPSTSRRAALAAGAGGLLTAGCGTTERVPAATTTSSPDADTQLAADAVTVSAELLALVRLAGRRRPDVRRRLAPLVDLHRAHLAVLPTAETAPGSTPGLGGGSDVVAEVLRRELDGSRSIRGWALEARSGPLARLLASMAAGIAAHVEDLR